MEWRFGWFSQTAVYMQIELHRTVSGLSFQGQCEVSDKITYTSISYKDRNNGQNICLALHSVGSVKIIDHHFQLFGWLSNLELLLLVAKDRVLYAAQLFFYSSFAFFEFLWKSRDISCLIAKENLEWTTWGSNESRPTRDHPIAKWNASNDFKLWYTTLIHLGIMWQVLNIEFDPVE